jgi:hypothetical protein
MLESIPIERLFIDFLVVLGIFLAVGIGLLLKFKAYRIRPAIILLLLFALTGTADVVITTHYAYLKPEMEANPLAAQFLSFEYGIILAAFLWAFGWILLCEAFFRLKLNPLAYFTLLVLFSGHLMGMLTWADRLDPESTEGLSWVLAFAYTVFFVAGLRLWKGAESAEAAPLPPVPERKPRK